MFKKIIYSCVFLIIFSVFCLFQQNQASASVRTDLNTQMNTAGNIGWGTTATPADMPNLIKTVISTFLGLLGIIFLVLIIYAGYNWMTAQGEEEKVTKAKDTITRAIIGLIIITAAYSITYFVFNNLPDGAGTGGAATGPIK